MCTLTARLMRARKRMGCRLSKSIIQAEKECYICRRWYAVKTTRGLEEHHILNGPLRSFSERHGLKVWLCHQHHNEPGLSAHHNATCAQTCAQNLLRRTRRDGTDFIRRMLECSLNNWN